MAKVAVALTVLAATALTTLALPFGDLRYSPDHANMAGALASCLLIGALLRTRRARTDRP
jgi:hypothetical protein